MKARKIKDHIYLMGSVDWDRRLFDSLVPLPDGTSYNAYLIEGSEKTVLLDSVDPAMADELLSQLETSQRLTTLFRTMPSRITLEQSRRFLKNTPTQN